MEHKPQDIAGSEPAERQEELESEREAQAEDPTSPQRGFEEGEQTDVEQERGERGGGG